MLRTIYSKFRAWQVNFNSSFGKNISTPKSRLIAKLHTHLIDHAWIRLIWTNMYLISPQVWRSNQPGPRRFKHLKKLGIRSIINLRGPSAFGVYLFEKEACAAHDIQLYDNSISAFHLNYAKGYLSLLDLFDRVEKPLLIHCKSGADRAGIASAFYLIDQMGLPVEQAMAQLSLKYAHRKNSKAGVQGQLLESYARANRETPISLRAWLETRYDQDEIVQAFRQKRGKQPKQ